MMALLQGSPISCSSEIKISLSYNAFKFNIASRQKELQVLDEKIFSVQIIYFIWYYCSSYGLHTQVVFFSL